MKIKKKRQQALLISISQPRWNKYRKYAQDIGSIGRNTNTKEINEFEVILKLYKKNIQLSAAFYPLLHCCEICLRNKIDHAMQQKYNTGRLNSQEFLFSKRTKKQIERAKSNITELSFVFWINLIGKDYDPTLWRRAIFNAFPNFKGKRKIVYNRFKQIGKFRNRIMHYKCYL